MYVYKEKGIPESSWNVLLNAVTENTRQQYNTAYKKWWNYCLANQIPIFHATENQVISFFQSEYDTNGFKYGTFNAMRSAVSSLLTGEMGKNLVVRRFLRGISKLRPQKPKYRVTWDTGILINYLEKMDPHENMSIELLGKKN